MKALGISVLAGVVFTGAMLTAQTPQQATPSANPLTDQIKSYFDRVKGYLTKSIDMVPADKWAWAPTPDVRPYSRLFGHITDDNNGACWQLGGLTARPATVDAPANNTESAAVKMSREELKKLYLDSFALCDKAFAEVTDQNAATPAVAGGRGTRLGGLSYNWSHINEHYGNLVTYFRLNGIVPPSSAGRGGF